MRDETLELIEDIVKYAEYITEDTKIVADCFLVIHKSAELMLTENERSVLAKAIANYYYLLKRLYKIHTKNQDSL